MANPFVIAKFLSIYFVNPEEPVQAANALSCGFAKIIVL